MNWYVGTDWSVIPAGGNSLRQVFVRLEDCEAVAAELAEARKLLAVSVLASRFDALAAELALLSDKACAAVVHYRTALNKLTDSFKYSAEVVTIARDALEAK